MDHAEATKRFVVEKYLLGDLGETQRDEFEDHYFKCRECAEDVKAGAILVANIQAVFREARTTMSPAAVPKRIQWFRFAGWGFVPAAGMAGCAVLAVLVGYQNLVEIPSMRAHLFPTQMVLTPATSIHAERAEQGLTISKRTGIMSVTIAHEWEEMYSRYEGEIERASDHKAISKAEIAATPSDVTVLAGLQPFELGSYFLNLYGFRTGSEERMLVARVPLTLME
jgi:hypothetical protein